MKRKKKNVPTATFSSSSSSLSLSDKDLTLSDGPTKENDILALRMAHGKKKSKSYDRVLPLQSHTYSARRQSILTPINVISHGSTRGFS